MANNIEIEVLAPGDGYITVFPSYNKVLDGIYIKDWAGVLDRLNKPLMLDMVRKDYNKLDDKKKLAIKFKAGGYDAGACPLARNIESGEIKPARDKRVPRPSTYNVIVLDADGGKDDRGNKVGISDGFDDRLASVLDGYEYYAHATISSTNAQNRRRILIPVKVPVSADVRECVIRYLAKKLGKMDDIDPASARNKQMMCMPVWLADGEHYAFHHHGELLDALDWLNRECVGWQDAKQWPLWENDKGIKVRAMSKKPKKCIEETGQWMPVPDKNRIHNAYNATYRISEILKDSGKYEQTSDRWSHTYDECKNGIKVTNDAVLYSYYGTDPLSVGQDLDAFEVALILHHGDIYDKQSWAKMYAEASNDEAVKKQMLSVFADLPEDAESWATMYDSTEEGMAQRCMAMFPHKILNNKWMRYDDKAGIYIESTDDAMLSYALRIVRISAALEPDDIDIQGMIGKASTARNIVKIWRSLATETAPAPTDWENQPWLLCFSDIVIDLKAYAEGREFRLKHSPDYLMTLSTGYPFENVENIKAEVMDEFINALELYIPDNDVREYLQKAFGRGLTATSASEDKAIWLVSQKGDRSGGNGKSTLLRAVKGAFGQYYYSIEGKYLYVSKNEGNPESPEVKKANMKWKRWCSFTEYDSLRTLDEEKYKNFTSAGDVFGRKCNSNDGEFELSCICVLDANGTPSIRRKQKAMLRRTRIINFDAEIISADGTVKDRWKRSNDIHCCCMAWLLMGFANWYASGCNLDKGINDESMPESIRQATLDWYGAFSDPMEFFDDYYCVTHDENDYIVGDLCYKTYLEQVVDRGATRHMFSQAERMWLREHGITTKRRRAVNDYGLRRDCYVGVKLVGTWDAQQFARHHGISVVGSAKAV